MKRDEMKWKSPIPLVQCFCLGLVVASGCNSSNSKWFEHQALKDRSIALLENGAEQDKEGKQLQEARQGFEQLTKAYPREKLGPTNAALTLLARLRHIDPIDKADEWKKLSKAFLDTLAKLRQLAPQDSTEGVLLSRYYLLQNENEKALESIQQAATKNAAADVYYQLYKLLQLQPEADIAEGLRALQEGLKRSPNNLVLRIAYLEALARAERAEFLQVLEETREPLRPITARNDSRIPKILDDAKGAAEKSDWRMATTQSIFLRNLLLAELAYQNDLHALEPHDLEFVELEFSSQLARTKASSKVQPLSLKWESQGGWGLRGVQAMAIEDFDLDGKLDLFLALSDRIEVWSLADAKPKTLLASEPITGAIQGMVVMDLDRDFQRRRDALPESALPTTDPPDAPPNPYIGWLDTDLDVVVYGAEGLQLYRNELDVATGKRSLVRVPARDGMENLTGIKVVTTIDMDHDSDLDLIVSSLQGVTLWSNRGDWTFANFTEYSRLPDLSKPVHAILAMDVDRNVLNDFVLAVEGQSPVWLSNNLHGRYRITDWKQPANASIGGKVIEAIDVNRDACWDLLNGSERGLEVQIMKSVGRHGWILDRQETLTQRPVLGVSVADLDWDGNSDCVAWGPEGLMVFRGNAEGRLKLEAPLMVDRKDIRSVALCDVDADGDDDGLVLNASGDIEVLLNSQSRKNHSLEVVIRADEDGKQRPRERCNMHGVGSLIEMKIGGAYQAKIVRGTRTVFGLGEQDHADVARILWTNGIPNNVIDIAHKKTIFDQQNLGGSCPYLYAWTANDLASAPIVYGQLPLVCNLPKVFLHRHAIGNTLSLRVVPFSHATIDMFFKSPKSFGRPPISIRFSCGRSIIQRM